MQRITKEKKCCDELLEFHRAANTDTIQSIALWQEQRILPNIIYLLIAFMYSRSLKISSRSIIFNYYSAWEHILAWPFALLQPSRTLPSFSIHWDRSCLCSPPPSLGSRELCSPCLDGPSPVFSIIQDSAYPFQAPPECWNFRSCKIIFYVKKQTNRNLKISPFF